jgi:coatomer subunit beta'
MVYMINTSILDRNKLLNLAKLSESEGLFNISFSSYFQINDMEKCLDILLKSNKIPEASLFCRTYMPSKLNSVIDQWNNELNNEETNNRISI